MHTKYGPSNAHRWLNCAASLKPREEERAASVHAELGTAAHALLETSLRIGREPAKFLGNKRMHKEFEVDEEMVNAVSHAYDWLHSYLALNKRAKFFIEHQVKLTDVLKAKQYEQGTADVIVDNYPKELVVMDYKHGAGVRVEAKNNPQLMLYACGFTLGKIYKNYRHVVVQPRARHKEGPVREWVCTHAELMKFNKQVIKRVAFNENNPDHAVAGDWCKWCAHAGTCRTLTEFALKTAKMEFDDQPPDPASMSMKEVSVVLEVSDIIDTWLKAVRGQALQRALNGTKIPGFKLALGRSIRYWSNEKRVAKFLSSKGYSADEYAPRSLLGVPGIEKLFKSRKRGAKLPSQLATMILRSKPAVHLVPESDEREEYVRGAEFDDIED